jgi:hypothetical protein
VKLDGAFASGSRVVIVWTFSGAVSGASFSVPVVTVLQTRGHQILTDDDTTADWEVIRAERVVQGHGRGAPASPVESGFSRMANAHASPFESREFGRSQ